jgi:cysteine synthase A
VAEAIRKVEAGANRSCDTHLHVFPLPPHWGVNLYLKDESCTQPVHSNIDLPGRYSSTASANGWVGPATTIIEASSGSTAVTEVYVARLLGLPLIAVMPASTSPEKCHLIEFYGGMSRLMADPGAIYDESHRLPAETGGHFMDQFTARLPYPTPAPSPPCTEPARSPA